MELLRRIGKDIKSGKNIDLYLTVIVAIVVAALNVLGIVPQSLMPFTLAVLALLAFATLGSRHQLETILQKIVQTKERFFFIEFSSEQQKALDNRIEKSQDLLIIGSSLSFIIDRYDTLFEKILRSGTAIRIVLINPYGPACDMVAKRMYLPMNLTSWRTKVLYTLKVLKDLQTNTSSGKLKIRVIDFHLAHGEILIDPDSPNGMIFLWYHSFKTAKKNRPKFILHPSDDYWYSHFLEEANAIWNNSIPWENVEECRGIKGSFKNNFGVSDTQ